MRSFIAIITILTLVGCADILKNTFYRNSFMQEDFFYPKITKYEEDLIIVSHIIPNPKYVQHRKYATDAYRHKLRIMSDKLASETCKDEFKGTIGTPSFSSHRDSMYYPDQGTIFFTRVHYTYSCR